jgi:uncharacterized protein DUF488
LEVFLRAKIMLMALDLASAVTTCLSAGRLAAHSLDVLFKYTSQAHGSACPSRNATARFRNEPSRNMQARQPTIWTIGHSTRPIDEFTDLLRTHRISLLLDVRTVPRSRFNPQFNRDTLARSLRDAGFQYRHLPELGGLRKPTKDSVNDGWRNASFRGYADYMQTEEFQRALEALMTFGRDKNTAIMCAEAVPWRCHRSLIADALVSRGWDSRHIMSPEKAASHVRTSFARFENGTLTYPKPTNLSSLF